MPVSQAFPHGPDDHSGTDGVTHLKPGRRKGRPELEGSSIAVGDLVVALDDVGDGVPADRCPLLLLHGAVQTRAVWEKQVDALAPHVRLTDHRWQRVQGDASPCGARR